MPTQNAPVSAAEAKAFFSDLEQFPVLVLAVSGGPDSTALMVLAARWRQSLESKPALIAVTIDHGLRAQAKREAAAVGRLARKLGLAHRTLRWTGKKPTTGLQQAARMARYRLLAEAAREAKAMHILTAHTLDDQAETVLIRMSRGSGVTGLGAMARMSSLPRQGAGQIKLVRPLLETSKSRLIATLRVANIGVRRRSFQPRSALHPGAAARPDAGVGARRSRCRPARAIGATPQARRPGDRSRGQPRRSRFGTGARRIRRYRLCPIVRRGRSTSAWPCDDAGRG